MSETKNRKTSNLRWQVKAKLQDSGKSKSLKCFFCTKDHRLQDCPVAPKCSICHKCGHVDKDCRDKKAKIVPPVHNPTITSNAANNMPAPRGGIVSSPGSNPSPSPGTNISPQQTNDKGSDEKGESSFSSFRNSQIQIFEHQVSDPDLGSLTDTDSDMSDVEKNTNRTNSFDNLSRSEKKEKKIRQEKKFKRIQRDRLDKHEGKSASQVLEEIETPAIDDKVAMEEDKPQPVPLPDFDQLRNGRNLQWFWPSEEIVPQIDRFWCIVTAVFTWLFQWAIFYIALINTAEFFDLSRDLVFMLLKMHEYLFYISIWKIFRYIRKFYWDVDELKSYHDSKIHSSVSIFLCFVVSFLWDVDSPRKRFLVRRMSVVTNINSIPHDLRSDHEKIITLKHTDNLICSVQMVWCSYAEDQTPDQCVPLNEVQMKLMKLKQVDSVKVSLETVSQLLSPNVVDLTTDFMQVRDRMNNSVRASGAVNSNRYENLFRNFQTTDSSLLALFVVADRIWRTQGIDRLKFKVQNMSGASVTAIDPGRSLLYNQL